MNLAAVEIKAFVPAVDLEISKQLLPRSTCELKWRIAQNIPAHDSE